MPRILTLLLLVLPLVGAETLERTLWYTGLIQGQPSASMQVSLYRQEDGSRRTLASTRILLNRTLGAQSVSIEVSEQQEMFEDASGKLTRFRIDQDQNGSVTSATGTVEGREVVATVSRLGRSDIQRIPIPEGVELLGIQSAQDLLASSDLAIGGSITNSGVVLLSGRVSIMETTADLLERRADGNLLFLTKTPVMPPFRTLLNAQGDLVKMEINLGFLSLILQPADGPVALAGAEISPTGIAKAAGSVPKGAAVERYRLGGAAAAIPGDSFQAVGDGVVTIRANSEPEDLAEPAPFLAKEPQFEIDDPDLVAWVREAEAAFAAQGKAHLAEMLRLRVRTHLSTKDLAMADGSALEAFRSRSGDCTEHANLLTAALRIAGIPARTEVGVVYATDFGGWVGHAWNSAYVDGRWIHLDSAYPGIQRSCYLKIATTTGDDPMGTAGAMAQAMVDLSGTAIEHLDD